MLFPSEVFLFVFLPAVLVVYYAFLRRAGVCVSDDRHNFVKLAFGHIGEPIPRQ